MTGTVRSQEAISFGYIPPQDPRLVYRLVGFLEYGKAIELLARFINSATPEERAIADELVREQQQFLIYTNLSRHIEGASLLSESRKDGDGDYKQHGLDWVLALARVEVGAMLAGFTNHPQPFQAVGPGEYEREAYRELLTDGARTHYWALKKDPVSQNYPNTGVPENHLIPYGRRVLVAQEFLKAAAAFSQKQLMAIQKTEIAAMNKEIQQLQLIVLYCLHSKMSPKRSAYTSGMSFIACPPLKAAAEREIGRGVERAEEGPVLENPFLMIEPRLIAIPCL